MSARRPPSRDECVAMIRDLVAFPTVSRDPNSDLIAYVEDYLTRHGVACDTIWNEDGTKATLWATIGPANRPGVILSGHSDIVPVDGQDWASDPFTLREADGRLYGRGACDMKGFVGLMLAFVPYFAQCDLKAPIHLAISYDEEVGCTGVRSLVDRLAGMEVKPALCIVGEPTSMRVIVGHKGGGVWEVRVTGLAAHSSLAPSAVNAIEYAAEIIGLVKELGREQAASGFRDDAYDVPYTTLSATMIGGGTATNIIPSECWFRFGVRALPEVDARSIVAKLQARIDTEIVPRMKAIAPECGVTITPRVEMIGLATDAAHPAVTFMKRLVGSNDHAKVAYGTEAGLFSRDAGIVSVVCGPGSIEQAHKPDEFLALSEVVRCREMLERLALHLEMAGPY